MRYRLPPMRPATNVPVRPYRSPRLPAWASELIDAVCTDAAVEPPTVVRWRRRSGIHSSGVTRPSLGVISVSAGSDELDARLTLLHELAHWIGPRPRRVRRRVAHHDRAFYLRAFPLYRAHGIPDAEALAREGSRYPSSLRHAIVVGVPGASAALAGRRVRLRENRRPWRVVVAEHRIRLVRDGRWTVCVICGARVVGAQLARLRRRRTPARHVLFART
ncbi:MAG: hypothetical protein M3O77_02005 [Chloroflexota bacterium]|nr:hypothetical protein [Chloroflexota bacterium]